MPSDSAETVEIPLNPVLEALEPLSSSSGGWTVEVAGSSHRGKVRTNNEDHFLICRFGRFLEALASNLPLDDNPGYMQENGYAMVVADGMGGHAAGEVASRLAINSLVQLAFSIPDWVLRFDDREMSSKAMNQAQNLALKIKDILVHVATHDPGLRGYGTTLALVWSVGKDLFILHVGDSRIYLFRRGTLQQLTRDHTVAQDLVDSGLISQQQVAHHFFRHHLSQCLNDSGAAIQPEVQHIDLQDGDRVLVCSDGLTDMINDQAISTVLDRSSAVQETCSELVAKSLEAGGRDNVTVIVADYRFSAGN